MFEKKPLQIYAIVVGVFFIFSGMGKAVDTAGFSYLISQYGLGYLMVLAPVIVLLEILLGLFLVLLINPKRNALYTLLLLVVFTIAFAYGHFVNGVNSCGCFGTVNRAELPPVFSFMRNFILMGMAFIVWLKYPAEENTVPARWKKYLIYAVMAIALFISGYTYKAPPFLTGNTESHQFQHKSVRATALAKYVPAVTNNRYLVFCFSYTCPYCWNSIENLRQFKKTNAVDSLIVLAVGGTKDKLEFENNFKPDFAIRDLTGKEMDELTVSYPTGFYITNDTVKAVIQSELPSPFIFRKMNN